MGICLVGDQKILLIIIKGGKRRKVVKVLSFKTKKPSNIARFQKYYMVEA